MLGNTIRLKVTEVCKSDNGSSPLMMCRADVPESHRTDFVSYKIYTIGARPGRLPQSLRVIASAVPLTQGEGKETVFVAAPEKVVCFFPEIQGILSKELDISKYSITCLFEKSCGAVVFRRRCGNTEFLLIQNKNGGNWGFPKGHVEVGETERETAMREVREETGLEISPMDGFRIVSEYHPRGRIIKKVIFFLAEMNGEEVTIQESEIDKYTWADYGRAMNMFKFNNDRNVMSKARDWLKKHGAY
jgi:8-oxo-dGTP pyrophosphatase MutT (NUDIX family)